MIIEEEQKVEIVEDSTKTEKQEFKQIPNNSEKTSKHWIMAICRRSSSSRKIPS